MQPDHVIWNTLSQHFCSFKTTLNSNTFCRNPYNLTGLCSFQSCPLANSRYATLLEDPAHPDRIVLHLKTVERAHTPKHLWEKVVLPRRYGDALEALDKRLEHWPKFIVHRAKQRLTKMTQYLIRLRRLRLKAEKAVPDRLVGVKKKVERREKNREKKALSAAKLDRSIEAELVERLRKGTYGDIYNYPLKQYGAALDAAEHDHQAAELELEDEEELEEELEAEDKDDDGEQYEAVYGSGEDSDDDSGDDDSDDGPARGRRRPRDIEDVPKDDFEFDEGSDLEGAASREEVKAVLRRRKEKRREGRKGKRGVRVEIEYENEPVAVSRRE